MEDERGEKVEAAAQPAPGAFPLRFPIIALLAGLVVGGAVFKGAPWWVRGAVFVTPILVVALWIVYVEGTRVGRAANHVVHLTVSPVLALLAFVLGLTPAVLAYVAMKWIAHSAPAWLQVPFLVVAAAWLLVLGYYVYDTKAREQRFTRLRRAGPLVPLFLALNLVFASVGVFAAIVLVLPDGGRLFVETNDLHHGRVADFFLWHFVDMIPLVDATETVGWKVPLTYTRAATGWLLLLFKVVVIVPALWLLAGYFKAPESTKAP